MSKSTLDSLREHLKRSLGEYGGSLNSGEGHGRGSFARLRLRSLVVVSWKLRELVTLDLEDQRKVFGDGAGLMLREWHIDKEGNVIDHRGVKRFNAEGQRLPC